MKPTLCSKIFLSKIRYQNFIQFIIVYHKGILIQIVICHKCNTKYDLLKSLEHL